MRSGMVKTLFAAIVCICLLPAGLWAQEDPNAPWDPNTHLAPYPVMMGKTAYFSYSEQDESPWEPRAGTTLELMGEIAVLDPNGLIGLCTAPVFVSILDEAGNPVYTPFGSPDVWSYEPVSYTKTEWSPSGEITWETNPYDFSIEMWDTGMTYPTMLSRIEWTMVALISDTVETVKLPFAPSAEWVELAPGLEIRVEETSIEEDRYKHRSTVILDPNKISYPDRGRRGLDEEDGLQGYSWPTAGRPETIVLEIDVLDAEGNSLQEHGTSVRLSGISTGTDYDEEGRMIMTQTIYGSGSGCSEIAFIGYVIVFEFHYEGLDMMLENVPVPPLCP